MTITNGSYGGSNPGYRERIEEFKNIDRDGNGRFTFDKSYEQCHVLAANNPMGFAVMSREEFEKNGNVLRLRPWGRIDVTTHPQRELEVELEPFDVQPIPGIFPLIPGKNTQKADFHGLAILPAVLPGAKYRVYGYANITDPVTGSSRKLLVARLDEPVSVASGETLKIELPLIGQPVRIKPQFAGVEKLLYPEDLPLSARADFQRKMPVTVELQRTDGKLTIPGQFNRTYGTVMFYTVEGAMYRLIVRVTEQDTESGDDSQPKTTVYTGENRITVYSNQGSWSVETLDLGEMVLVPES
jgi:hypothetical protein